MERLLTRRNLFEFLAGGAVVAGAEAAFVRKPVQAELTDDILTSLQERSKKNIFSNFRCWI